MRDPKRIDRILKLIGKEWKKCPDLRFGQLLIVIGVGWNDEDDVLEKWLKKR